MIREISGHFLKHVHTLQMFLLLSLLIMVSFPIFIEIWVISLLINKENFMGKVWIFDRIRKEDFHQRIQAPHHRWLVLQCTFPQKPKDQPIIFHVNYTVLQILQNIRMKIIAIILRALYLTMFLVPSNKKKSTIFLYTLKNEFLKDHMAF